MSMNCEKNVFELRVPAHVKLEKKICTPELGMVAATMNYFGSHITFFRTDFLPIERYAWDPNENLVDGKFHEEIPSNVLESIEKNGGFFLSRNFLSRNSDRSVTAEGNKPTRKLVYEEIEALAKDFCIPELASDLPYGAIYDVIGWWLIKTKTLSEKEWRWSPTRQEEQMLLLCRDCGGWTLGELLGNIFTMEWTKEKYEDKAVSREGVPFDDGEGIYPARKRYMYDCNILHPDANTRAFLYFK